MAEHMQNGGQHRGGAGKHFRGQEEEEAQTRVVRPKPVRAVSDVYGEGEGSRQSSGQSYSHAAVPGAQTDWDPYTATGFGEAPHGHHHHHKSHRTLAIVLCIVAAVVVALGVSGYFFYRSAKTVAADASSLVSETTAFSKSLASGDTSSLDASAQKIESLASSMEEETQSPLWSVASAVPVVGSDISKVRTLASVAHDLSTKVVTPAAQSLSGITMKSVFSDGKIDIATVQTLCNTVSDLQPEIDSAAKRVDALGTAQLEQLKEPLEKAKSTLDELDAAATGMAEVAPSLPSMLGANGARNYLVIAQNNSEIRSTGGFPGSRMVLTIDNGQIELGDFQAVGTHFAAGTIPLTDEEYHVVNDIMQTGATFAPGDVNAVPSFPRAAQLMKWCWEAEGNDTVDGVVAIDPVFLQSLLGLVGGVTTEDGTVVDGTNAAEILLNKTYYLPTAEQDPFFSEVASLAMNKVMSSLGSASMTDLAKTVEDGVSQGRFLVYMDNADEESAIASLGAEGEVNQDSQNPVTGFYIYDKTGSKLDWYLDMRSSLSEPTTNADGTKSYQVTVTLHNTTTLEQMEDELPDYITGTTPEVHNYSMITSFMAMAPAGGTISDFKVDADEVNSEAEATLYGNDVWAGYVNIYPSATATFTYTVTTAAGANDLSVWKTPTGRSFE
jgi:hypothetical protein